MNHRLFLSRCYLIGPMDFNREAGIAWRLEISPWLFNRGIIPLDPYNKPLYAEDHEALENDDNFQARREAKERGDWQAVRDFMKPIVACDLRMVDEGSFFICYLDLLNKPCGTYDELFMAANQNKPIIVMCPQGIKEIPDWLFGRLKWQMFFDDWNDVKEYIRHIDEDDNIETLNRWKFFKLADRYRDALCQSTLLPS